MDWLEQNLDAYRILAEILNDLRIELRKGLEQAHGAEWFRPGLPPEVFDRLVSSKEGSSAIDWYETEYQEIMDFAVFPDFVEILNHNKDLFPALLALVPSPALFQARFLELESLRSRVGRARPVSEAELTFLMTFNTRFRKQLELHRAGETDSPSAPKDSEEVSIETPHIEEAAAEPPPESEESALEQPIDEEVAPNENLPPQRKATGGGASGKDTEEKRDDPEPKVDAADPIPVATGPLSQVVASGDSTAILRELFKEVTSLAESLWSSDVPPPQTVWKEVRISSWYEEKFSALGLKPLSDFYDVISHVEDRLGTGLAKHELQKMLEDANFAHILLALRDMFQKNRI